jgi:hypothetical protein
MKPLSQNNRRPGRDSKRAPPENRSKYTVHTTRACKLGKFLLVKLIVDQLVEVFPALCGTGRFIIVLRMAS